MSVVQDCVPFSSGDSALCWLEQLSTEKILHIATTTKKQATKHSVTHARTHKRAHTQRKAWLPLLQNQYVISEQL